jgi:hypothetical protein
VTIVADCAICTRRAEAERRRTIGVSCGHRVPREPVLVDGRKLYWCETCGEHRMSGKKPTGGGHDYLLRLAQLVEEHGPITVDDPGTAHGRAVVRALGAELSGRHVVRSSAA